MHLPQIPLDGIGYVCVLLTTRFGAFVDVGTERGIFLPFSNMIGRVEKDQYIWVKLYKDKSNRLAVTMHVEDEMRRIALPCLEYKVGDSITGTIYNITPEGAFLLRTQGYVYMAVFPDKYDSSFDLASHFYIITEFRFM